jgi:aldehyde:ferredoxin oxidoreductase
VAKGYWAKMLRIDLGTRQTKIEEIPEETLRMFIGGAGMGAKILWEELPGRINPYDGKNLLIFATGPFQGPSIPGGAKFSITGISPLTHTYADTAAGADWGPSLKDSGYDALVIEGISDVPVYLHIVDGVVAIRDSAHLWGMDSYETVDAIHKETGDERLSIAAIGPAGEKLVAIACIAIDKHSFAGRCGMGALMGSKRLKAIAVRGGKKAVLHDLPRVRQLLGKYQRGIYQAVLKNQFRKYGTPGLCETAEGLGDMPIRYWGGDVWPEGAKKLGGENYTKALNARPWPCKYCPVGCHRKITITEPLEYAQQGVGPEYETIGMMGTNLLIDDPKVVAKGNDIANRLGLDTISVGAMVGFAIDCFEKGLITTKDTNGLELKWGDPHTFFSLIEQIGRKEGLGAIFSEGTLSAARKIHPDAVKNVVHCKGLDFPAHDPRTCNSLAISYATGTRGACHFRGPCEDVEMGGFFMPEIGITQGMVRFFEPKNQSFLAARCQDLGALVNSLVLCMFMVDGGEMSFTELRELLNAITGWDYSINDLVLAGERIFTLQRLINLRDGYNAQTDVMPPKMFTSAKEGFRAGRTIPFEGLMKDYYNLRGWDLNGEPKDETLKRLGLREYCV